MKKVTAKVAKLAKKSKGREESSFYNKNDKHKTFTGMDDFTFADRRRVSFGIEVLPRTSCEIPENSLRIPYYNSIIIVLLSDFY